MSTSTRLILLLTVLAGAAMAAGGYYSLKLSAQILSYSRKLACFEQA